MKHFFVILIFGAMVIGASDAAAQSRKATRRAERTSSAQAAYGVSPERQNWAPRKKSKSKKNARRKPAKGTQAKAGKSYRRGGSGPKFFPTF